MKLHKFLRMVLAFVIAFSCVSFLPSFATPPMTPFSNQDSPVSRLSGNNRYGTAVAISQEGWVSADVVVLARGDDYADALAGVPLAYALDAPILLTPSARLSSLVRDEIIRLNAKEVIVLGGYGAISEEVEDILTTELGLAVKRIAGSNRYGTAAEIARELAELRKSRLLYWPTGRIFLMP